VSVDDIERAVQQLSPDDLAEFRHWFAEFDQAVWDAELERDAAAGRLDKLANDAVAEFHQGRTRPL
jgi:hypothetical protein